MALTPCSDAQTQAQDVIAELLAKYSDKYGLSSLTPSIYDTAWVSLVHSNVHGSLQWTFPEAFDFIYSKQSPDGGWKGNGSVADAVICTLSCLLSFVKHASTPGPSRDYSVEDLTSRASLASKFLSDQLQGWDVLATERIAFELIVPSLLEQLEACGYSFDFPGRETLMKLRDAKMVKIKPEVIYAKGTSVIHSLEALVGKLDFDQVAHHLRNGSMLASPASTAAFLIHASKWNVDAEEYLRHVLNSCRHYGYGNVCNVYPTTMFELAWPICTLYEAGIKFESLCQEDLMRVRDILWRALSAGNGLVGFSTHDKPEFEPDSDDTCKALMAVQYLGKPYPLDTMLLTFERKSHFLTFLHERNPSFSGNCNVLLALLRTEDPNTLAEQITKVATFIVNEAWMTDGQITDKWHLSPWYLAMLMTQGLSRILYLHAEGRLTDFPHELLRFQIPTLLFTTLIRLLEARRPDGLWGSREETAYAIISLATLSSLPAARVLDVEIENAIAVGRRYLQSPHAYSGPEDDIWVGKVAYDPELVRKAYVVAALYVPVPLYTPSDKVWSSPDIVPSKISKITSFFSGLPTFVDMPRWRLTASVAQAMHFLPEMERESAELPNRAHAGELQAFTYLSVMIFAGNAIDGTDMNLQLIYDQLVMSVTLYHIDDVYDDRLLPLGEAAVAEYIHMVESNMESFETGNFPPVKDERLIEVVRCLSGYVQLALTHPRMAKASKRDKEYFRSEMKLMLLAYAKQALDSARFRAQKDTTIFQTPDASYFRWARGQGSDHYAMMYTLAYVTCLVGHRYNSISGGDRDCLPTPEMKYYSDACGRHAGVSGRILNDLGSLKRDQDAGNLNSTNFPEFHGDAVGDVRSQLRSIAEYEWALFFESFDALLNAAKKELGATAGSRVAADLKGYYRTIRVLGEIYYAKDVGYS